jgi:hypothetical protein
MSCSWQLGISACVRICLRMYEEDEVELSGLPTISGFYRISSIGQIEGNGGHYPNIFVDFGEFVGRDAGVLGGLAEHLRFDLVEFGEAESRSGVVDALGDELVVWSLGCDLPPAPFRLVSL